MTFSVHTTEAPRCEAELLPEIALLGRITWLFSGSHTTQVARAVQRAGGRELFMDCVYPANGSSLASCRVLLRRVTARALAGPVVLLPDNQPIGTCTCRFYTNGLRFALVGRWREGEIYRDWVAELSPS